MKRFLLTLFAVFLVVPGARGGETAAPHRIVAVGDLHGDYGAFVDIVEAAGLADADGHWTGGDSTFVQLGDVPDRGPDSLRIIRFLQGLEKSAPGKGGEVVALVGNHEAMNMTGDLRYVDPGEYAAFADGRSAARRDRVFAGNRDAILAFYRAKDPDASPSEIKRRWEASYPLGKVEHILAWSPNGEIGQWVMTHPAIAKIGDTLFVHGGISVETAAMPIATVNAEVSAALARGASEETSILTEPHGPLWYRGNVSRAGEDATERKDEADPPSIGAELSQVLAAYDARRLVVGHTPDPQGIIADEGGRLLRIDSGISAAYGGRLSYLEIADGKTIAWQKARGGEWQSRVLPNPGEGEAK